MRWSASHGRLSIWQLALVILVPTLIALAGGAWLAYDAWDSRAKQAEAMRGTELSSNARSVTDLFLAEIDQIQLKAQAIQKFSRSNAATSYPDAVDLMGGLGAESPLLYWADVEKKGDNSLTIRASLKNPFWREGGMVDDALMQGALKKIDFAVLKAEGKAILRMRQDPHRDNEWLVLAFAQETSKKAAQHSVQPLVVALVDPANFRVFDKWGARDENGYLRAFLIGSDGHVLAHSQKAYAASDFSAVEVFRSGVSRTIAGESPLTIPSNFQYRAIDQLHVTAAFARVGRLPLAVVLERIKLPGQERILAASTAAMISTLLADGLVMVAVLILLSAVGAMLLFRERGESPESSQDESFEDSGAAVSEEDAVTPPAEVQAAMSTLLGTQGMIAQERARMEKMKDVLVLQEMPPSETPTMESPRQPRNPVKDAVDAQILEQALVQELQSPPEASRARQEKRVALAQFENDLAELRNPALVFQRVVTYAHEVCASPVLLFSYNPMNGQAAIQTCAGFAPGSVPKGVSFSVTPDLLQHVERYGSQGRIIPVTEFRPLVDLITKVFRSSRFKAWAIYGRTGKLTAILAVLNPGEQLMHPEKFQGNSVADSLGRAIRSTGYAYENAIRSTAK